jgi:hypothetical protein
MYPHLIQKRSSMVQFFLGTTVVPLSADEICRWDHIVAEFIDNLLRVHKRTCLRHHAEGRHFFQSIYPI